MTTTAFAVSKETEFMPNKTSKLAKSASSKLEKVTAQPVKGISEYRLKTNGLRVLLVENHAAPVVATTVVYHVGSRNEAVGYTGATHFLEHMMFKGTSRFDPLKKNGIDDILKKVGGINNATTWFDRTNYYEMVPARHVSLCLDIESDRMRNLLLRQSDKDAEMSVVRNELEQGEDDPDELLETNLFATAFREHPYHHPTIGWRSDVEGVPISRLKKFYDDFYWPDNATLIVIGDIDRDKVLKMIEDKFSGIPRSKSPFPDVYTEEPAQEGERRFVVRRGTDVPRMVLGYHIPRCMDKDTYALDVLEHVLGDSSRKSSRLYKMFIGTGKASFVDASNYSLKDPGLFVLSAQSGSSGKSLKLEKLESLLKSALKELKEKPVSKDELKKAKAAITKSIRLTTADPLGFSMYLTEALAVADWRWFVDYPEQLEKVTAEDVMAVAKKYFSEDNSTTGYYYPRKDSKSVAKKKAEPSVAKDTKTDSSTDVDNGKTEDVTKSDTIAESVDVSPDKSASSRSSAKSVSIDIASRVKRSVLPNGLTVLSLNIPESTTVAISGKIKAGDDKTSVDKSQVPYFVASLMTSGSKSFSKEALADELEMMGCDLDFEPDTFWSEFDSHIVKEDLPRYLKVLSSVLKEPLFSAKELKLETNLRKSDLKESMADTDDLSWNLMLRSLYKPGSPFYQKKFSDLVSELEKLKAEDLKRFHRQYYTAGQTVISFVGAVEHEDVLKLVKKHLGSWEKGELRERHLAENEVVTLDKSLTRSISIPDKANVDIRVAKTLPVSFDSDDYYACVLANAALGYDSFACRLAPVRDKYGLTYGIYSVIDDPTVPYGPWYIKYSVNPVNLERANSIVKKIVSDYVNSGITESELATEKAHLSGTYSVYLRSPQKIAGRLTLYEAAGVDLSYIDNYSKNLYKVSRQEVNKAIKKYFDINERSVTAMSGTLPGGSGGKNKKEKK